MHWVKAMAVALGAPALVTLLAFTSVRTVVPGLLYMVAIILATAVGGRIGGLVAVAASAYPFFHFFASRYDRDQVNAEGATALAVFVVAALFGSEVLGREREARERAERAVRESESALDAATRLQNVADALATAHTPQEVLDAVLTEGVRAAEARGGLIATLSDDGEWLEVIASRGYDMQFIEPFLRFPVSGNFPLSEAVRTGEGVFIRSEAERDKRTPSSSAARSRGTGSCACRWWVNGHDRRARLLLPDRPGVPARAPGAQDRARTAGCARARAGPVLGGRADAARAALLPRRGDCAAHLVARARADARAPHRARRAAARRLVLDLHARRGDGRDRAARRRPPGSRAQALGRGDAASAPARSGSTTSST